MTRNKNRFQVSAGALLLAAALYYLGDAVNLAAVLLPALVHELGHVLALQLLGLRIKGFRVELKGFCIEYCGYTGAMGHALAAGAGPLFGFAYALAASAAGNRLQSEWLLLSAGTSLLLSLFNLLPALPLDGGRILLHLSCALLGERRGRGLTEAVGLVMGAALMAAGIWLMVKGRGLGVEIAAIWLLLYQETGSGLVKMREMI